MGVPQELGHVLYRECVYISHAAEDNPWGKGLYGDKLLQPGVRPARAMATKSTTVCFQWYDDADGILYSVAQELGDYGAGV